MNDTQHLSYLAEISQLESILAEIPDEDVIERMGFQHRLESAQEAIKDLDPLSQPTPKAILTFRGAPVFGTEGIASSFGSKAFTIFSETVSAIASDLAGSLMLKGPLPANGETILTNIARGSFGFEFEVKKTGEEADKLTSKALQKTLDLISVSATGSDEDVSEAMDEIHPRAVKKMAEFIDIMDKNGAWCSISFKGKKFKFSNLDQVSVSKSRLDSGDVTEGNPEYKGLFTGLLPEGRNFEFTTEEGEIIKGKIMAAAGSLAEFSKNTLYKEVTATFNKAQIGERKARYSLVSLDRVVLNSDQNNPT
jgi:hypothetical protein